MNNEDFIRQQVFRLLREQEEPADKQDLPSTSGPGPGRFKKELQNLKALSDSSPKQLMQNLGIKPGVGNKHIPVLMKMMSDAISSAEEMGAVYNSVAEQKDAYGRSGALIKLTGELSARDSLVFIRETFLGAKKAGFFPFADDIQVEILGDQILAYPSAKPFRWNKKPKTAKTSTPESAPSDSKEESKPPAE